MGMFMPQMGEIIEQRLFDLNAAFTEENWKLSYYFIGLDDYPIFEESYRETLNNKIIRHYYTREIGAETVGRWRMFMRDTMHLIMPYYNQLYESEILAKGLEPLGDRNIEHREIASGSSNSSTTGNNETANVFQDTPQNEMIPLQIKQMEYATNVSIDNGSATSTANGSYDNSVTRTEAGYMRPQAELLRLYRETFLNIDMEIVTSVELAQNFMTIWRR